MLSAPMASYTVLDALGNLNLNGPLEDPPRTRPKKTFTRLTRTVPASSPSAFLLSNTLLPHNGQQKPTQQDTTPSALTTIPPRSSPSTASTSKSEGNNNNHNNNANTRNSCSSRVGGLDRFRASSALSPISQSSDFLDSLPSIDPGRQQQLFTAHRRYDREDAQKAALSFLQENSVLKPPPPQPQPTTTATATAPQPLSSSALSEEHEQLQVPVRSRALFTRITSKPRFNAFGSPKLGHSGSLHFGSSYLDGVSSTTSSCGSSINGDDDDSTRSFTPLQEDPVSTATSIASSSPSAPLSLSPVSTSPPSSVASSSPPVSARSLSLDEAPQQYHQHTPQPRYHALPHYKAQAPSLLLSLSPSTFLSPPSSAVPSLSSASSYNSLSSCSSLSSLLSSSPTSPPTKQHKHHFVFPVMPAADRHSWWQQRPTSADLLSSPEEIQFSTDPLKPTATEYFNGRLASSLEEKQGPIRSTGASETFLKDQSSDDECKKTNEDFLQDWNSYYTPVPHQCRLNSRGFEQIKPKAATTLSNRTTRTPSPPSVNTGFCSISCQGGSNSINSSRTMIDSGEPSPQDFLGESDLPYPLPSTLQERLARQRKRAEQLRLLKLREEREEARENWRRIRRRGASFTAGVPCSALSSSPPASSSPKSRPISLSQSLSSSSLTKSSNSSNPSPLGAGQEQSHLKRSPSSPVKGNTSVAAKSRRCVGFDLKRTKVFEYDAFEWTSGSTASTPALSSSSERKGYFDLCRRGTATDSPQCEDDFDDTEDSDVDSSEQDEVRDSEVTRRYRRAAAVYPGSTRQMTM